MHFGQNSFETHTFDLVIVGGGLPGLCAAIAAARAGTKVALIQDRPVFGGNCSSEIRVVPHGTAHSNSWGQETGLPHAIILEDRAQNHECFFDHGMINSGFDRVMIEAARREPNIRPFFNTTVRAVESEPLDAAAPVVPAAPTLNGLGRLGGEPRRITSVRGSQLGSEKELVFRARQFMDATGDGTIGFLGGADFRYGREARAEFGENLAPLTSDETTMGSTITMRARDIGRVTPFVPPPWIQIYKTLDEIGHKRTLYHLSKPVYGGYWWLEICNPFHQIHDNQEIRDELHKHVLGVWNYIKNHSPEKEIARTYVLDWLGMVPGKRESRRLVGDVVVNEIDCHTDRSWPDSMAYAGWWIDLHMKGGILNKIDPGERENVDRNYKHWIRIAPFSLPLRAFYSRNVVNLWMVGRCLSVTHVALGPVRNMQTLGMMGHAVGLAAAYALRLDLTPRATASPSGPHIARLRQQMLREDVRILGLKNTDLADFALAATATASSAAPLDLGRVDANSWYHLGSRHLPGKLHSLALGMVVPLTYPRLEFAEFYLRNEQPAPQRLTVTVQRLERIWDRPDDQPVVATAELIVPANSAGWCTARFAAAIEPGHPYRLALSGGEGVAWAACADWPVGTTLQYLHVCSGGPEPKNVSLPSFSPAEISLPSYRHWRQLRTALALRLTPVPTPFGACNVNNGFAWPERLPNLWVSDPSKALPQHVELRWPAPVAFTTADVSFDTNLARISQSEPAFYRAPECARDWRLLAETADGWREIFAERDNIQRKRRTSFPRVLSSALRLEILTTNGAAEARVYEIRVYDE
jgi:hypothetical protein